MTSFDDIIVVTSPKNATKLTSQNFSILDASNKNFWLFSDSKARITKANLS